KGFGRAVSRILSTRQNAGERIICLSSQYPEPVPQCGTETGRFRVPYLALHPTGFSVPPRLRLERWALTPPFHPYRRIKDSESTAAYFLWPPPSGRLTASPPACILLYDLRQANRLRGIAPYGVRTFLSHLPKTAIEAILRPSKTAESIPSLNH